MNICWSQGKSPVNGENFPASSPALGHNQRPIQLVLGASFLRKKRTGREVDHCAVCSACSYVCVVVQKNCYRGQCYRSVQYGVWCAEELLQRAMLPQCAVRCVVCRRTVTEGNVTAVCSTVCGVQKNCCRGQCYRSVQYGVWCAEVGTFVGAVIIIRRDRKMCGKFNWRVRSVCVTTVSLHE